MRPVAGGRVMLVVQPSGGRPASRYLVLSGSLAGRPAGGGTRTGTRENWREFRGLAVAVLSFARARSRRGRRGPALPGSTDYPWVFRCQPDNQETESRRTARCCRGSLVGQNATGRRTALPSPPPGRRRSVYDTTVLRPSGARNSSANTRREPDPEEPGPGRPGDGELGLAAADRAVPGAGQR